MKNIKFIAIAVICISVIGCTQQSSESMDEPLVDNKYNTAGEAFKYVKENLHLILNEGQMRSYGLTSEKQIMNLSVQHELPLYYIPMENLKDTIVRTVSDAMIYTLGEDGRPKICVTVKNPTGEFWIISSVGHMKYIVPLSRNKSVTAIVEILGLEIGLLEMMSENGMVYKPIVDYPEAEIFMEQTYSLQEVYKYLEYYRADLERRFGKEFLNGQLDM